MAGQDYRSYRNTFKLCITTQVFVEPTSGEFLESQIELYAVGGMNLDWQLGWENILVTSLMMNLT